jgi:signal transduction histidine kinase
LAGGMVVAVTTFVCFRLGLQLLTPALLYLIIIVLLSLRSGFLSAAIVSFIAVGCLTYFFAPPLFSFRVSDPINLVAMAAFLTTAGVITHLVSRVRKLMQEKLQQSEAYLSEAQQLSHTGSFGWNASTGEIVWSAETFRIFDYSPTAKPGVELVLQRVHPEDIGLVRQTIERASQDGKDFAVEHRLLMPGGAVKHVHIVAHGSSHEPRKIEFVGAVMDITERKRTDDALRRTQMNLARAARLTMVGELTATIAHEVNQPLAAVVTNANACLRWLEHEPPNLEEARDAVRRIARDGHRGSEVIARIRGLLKKEHPARSRLDVNNVVQETLALARVDLQGATLETDLARGLPEVTADRIQLQQVLLNLMLNALDAMKPVSDRPRTIRIATSNQGGGMVLVAVCDSGAGLNSKQQERLFEPFHTTKPDGLGLGLSICHTIIEGHGGRLWAESNDGPGATFQFTLPAESGGTS